MIDVQKQSSQEWLADYDGKSSQDTIAPFPARIRKTEKETSKSQKTRHSEQMLQAPQVAIAENVPAHIPEGKYVANCCKYKFSDYFSTTKLVLMFEIYQGQYAGTSLECFFNLDRKKSADGEFNYAPKPRSDYMRMMRKYFEPDKHNLTNWLSPDNLLDRTYRVEVVTVNKDREKKALGERNEYSKIKTNIELINENENT